MNNKGFAITTIVYSVIILLSLVAITTLGILKTQYDNQKNYVNDIKEELNICLQKGTC